jgi:AcrR family transcriptional regulator
MATPSRPALRRPRPPVKHRRDRERATRRREIIDAARVVFAARGFDNATLEEIAERAEYGKGTVYNYFVNKESLFEAALESLIADVRDIAAEIARKRCPVREGFLEYTRRMVAYYQRHYDFCQMMLREWGRGPRARTEPCIRRAEEHLMHAVQPLAEMLGRGMRAGEIRRADPVSLGIMFFGLLHEYFMHAPSAQGRSGPRTTQSHTNLVVSVFFDGVGRADAASRA